MSVDPTAFPIAFDPTVQRMVGTARHGNTPFDVTFISEIADNLWSGGCTNGLVLPPHIKHLVSLYPWERYSVQHELDSALTVRMYDDLEGPDLATIRALGQWINRCRLSGPTLVHCQAGLNRSGLVTAYALMLDGLSAGSAAFAGLGWLLTRGMGR